MDFKEFEIFVSKFSFRANLTRELLECGAGGGRALLRSLDNECFLRAVRVTRKVVVTRFKDFALDDISEKDAVKQLSQVFISIFTDLLTYKNSLVRQHNKEITGKLKIIKDKDHDKN